MALIKGMLAAYSDPVRSVPTIVPFQYNPTEVTRTIRLEQDPNPDKEASLAATAHAVEDYSLRLELDATDGLEREGPVTRAAGIAPRLAALELLMQPAGESVLGSIFGATGIEIPPRKLPLVLLMWGPGRVAPVSLKSLKITETAFDELLNPIHATVDLGLTVLRDGDLDDDDQLAKAAVTYYEGARETKALLQLPQLAELSEPTLR